MEKFIVPTVIAIYFHLNRALYPRKHPDSTLQNLQRKGIIFLTSHQKVYVFELLSFQV